MLLRDTVTRLRGTAGTGSYGSDEIDWSSPTELDMSCEFQPMTTDEEVALQQRTESFWRVFLPAGADVLATDRLRFDGVDYEIDGEPRRWRMNGREHHVELVVTRVVGG